MDNDESFVSDGEADTKLRDSVEVETERVRSLRSTIDAKLREQGVYDQIRDLVRAKASLSATRGPEASAELRDGAPTGEADKENVIHQVLESDLVQRIVESVRAVSVDDGKAIVEGHRVSIEPPVKEEERESGGHVLYLRLQGGKAFVDQLTEEQDDDAMQKEVTASHVGSVMPFFRLTLTFQEQLQSSRDVVCTVDPAFDEHFRFRIDKRAVTARTSRLKDAFDVEVASPWEALCRVDEPVQIHLLKVTKKLLWWKSPTELRWRELATELVAVHRLDWRRVLCSSLPMTHLPVQLVGGMKAPVGTLDFRADVINYKRTARIAHAASALLHKQSLEQNARSHSFFKYAKQWWEEYRSETRYVDRDGGDEQYSRLLAHVSTRPRLIKLFAEDEEGRYRMVCRFLVPLRVPSAVRGPSEAARFVSLLPLETRTLVGGTRDEVWRTISTFLALKKGDALDHAVRSKLGLSVIVHLYADSSMRSCCSHRCSWAADWTRSSASALSRRPRTCPSAPTTA